MELNLPWKQQTQEPNLAKRFIEDADSLTLAMTFPRCEGYSAPTDEECANFPEVTDFICKAVNFHDRLVELGNEVIAAQAECEKYPDKSSPVERLGGALDNLNTLLTELEG